MNQERLETVLVISTIEAMNKMLEIEHAIDPEVIENPSMKDAISVFSKIKKALAESRSGNIHKAMDELFGGYYDFVKGINFQTELDCCLVPHSKQEEIFNSIARVANDKEVNDYISKFCKQNNIGYVYLIKGTHQGKSKYKIGKAIDINERLRKFEVVIPFDIDLLYAVRVKNPVQLEKLLHRIFAKNRLQGEWFDFDCDEIIRAIFLIKNVSECFDSFSTEWTAHQERKNKLTDDDYIEYLESLLVISGIRFDKDKRLSNG
jgi:hypothetical protein